MTPKASPGTLQELIQLRQDLIDVHQRNNLTLEELFGKIYPDKAHFIFELLQNADDAQANHVHVELQPHQLTLSHDGARLFTIEDVEAITNMGRSTKKDESTAIGKFGVGFKAVFQYTETPHIYSGEFKFKIIKMFLPDLNISHQREDTRFRTTFVFPFDRSEKPAATAVDEIAQALNELGPESILFLPHIQHVSYKIPKKKLVSLDRMQEPDGRVRVEATEAGSPTESSRWMLLWSITKLKDQRGNPISVAAAFNLTSESANTESNANNPGTNKTKSKPSQPTEHIVPVEDGRVCVYFPAVRENSGLRFHIHAPFATTPVRDSIIDSSQNDDLIAAIGSMIASALPHMVETGLMTEGLLETLPNEQDGLKPKYSPIRQSLIQAFNVKNITPKKGGGHSPAVDLYRAPALIAQALEASDLRFLSNPEEGWEDAKTTIGKNFVTQPKSPRARAFIQQLHCIDADLSELAEWISDMNEQCGYTNWNRWPFTFETDEDFLHKVRSWMEHFDQKALHKFYVLLGKMVDRDEMPAVQNLPLVCILTESGTCFVPPREALIPEMPQGDMPGFVPNYLYSPDHSGGNEEQRPIRQFLLKAGVRIWNTSTQVQREITEWTKDHPEGSGAPLEVNAEDVSRMTRFIAHLTSHPEARNLLAESAIFPAVDGTGVMTWQPASRVYIDSPYEDTGYKSVADARTNRASRLQPLASGFQEIEGIAGFASELGSLGRISVSQAAIGRNPQFRSGDFDGQRRTDTGYQTDWDINDLASLLTAGDGTIRAQIWHLITSGPEKWAIASYRTNASHDLRNYDSQLIQTLRKSVWIPDRDGNLRKPSDINETDLPDEFPCRPGPLLDAIKFGAQSQAALDQTSTQELAAQAAGFGSVERLTIALQLTEGKTMAELHTQLEDQKANQHGSSAVFFQDELDDPERRLAKSRKKDAASPNVEREQRWRSVRLGSPQVTAKRKAYLRLHYNSDQIMTCQCCRQSMPFKLADGSDYFEAVMCFPGHPRESDCNTLALCPVCAAKFQHANDTTEDELRQALLRADVSEPNVPLTMAKADAWLYFTKRHFIDLKGLLNP
jgi:hypothetical protein